MATVLGPTGHGLARDEGGYRTYKLTFKVETEYGVDACANALAAVDAAQAVGSPWELLGETDVWVWRRPETTVEPFDLKEGHVAQYYTVECTYSNKPLPTSAQRCSSTPIEDPLLEPVKVSGATRRDKKEAVYDRFGNRITTSSWEQIRGPQVEFNESNGTVTVVQNVGALQLDLCNSLSRTVNQYPLWGFPSRCVRLANFTWEKKYYGQCYSYFTRTFEFETDTNTFDRDLLDEGTKVLHGHWSNTAAGTGSGTGTGTGAQATWVLDYINGQLPDNTNPNHFDRYKDRNYENTKVILNGAGFPANVILTDGQYYIRIVSGNGEELDDDTVWVPTPYPVRPLTWSAAVTYNRGQIVDFSLGTGSAASYTFYVCLADGVTSNPFYSPVDWAPVEDVVRSGDWNIDTFYVSGDWVRNTVNNSAGSIHVEYYAEADYAVLLGLPMTLEQ